MGREASPERPAVDSQVAEDVETRARDARRRGDRRAVLTILMESYGARIYGVCRAALRDAALAKDVHQQVFVQAFRDLDRFGERSTFCSWLYAIARNRCLDALDGRRRWLSRFTMPGSLPEPASAEAAADEQIGRRASHQALAGCLDQLRPHIRMAVLLRFGEGLTFEEIARVSRERSAAVQMRVMRALPILRKCLDAQAGGGA